MMHHQKQNKEIGQNSIGLFKIISFFFRHEFFPNEFFPKNGKARFYVKHLSQNQNRPGFPVLPGRLDQDDKPHRVRA